MGWIFKERVTDSVDYAPSYSYRSHTMVVEVEFNQCPNKVPVYINNSISNSISTALCSDKVQHKKYWWA